MQSYESLYAYTSNEAWMLFGLDILSRSSCSNWLWAALYSRNSDTFDTIYRPALAIRFELAMSWLEG